MEECVESQLLEDFSRPLHLRWARAAQPCAWGWAEGPLIFQMWLAPRDR